jgi:hypothetical protein
MRSFLAGFSDSKLGKAEAQWRRKVIVKKKNKKKKRLSKEDVSGGSVELDGDDHDEGDDKYGEDDDRRESGVMPKGGRKLDGGGGGGGSGGFDSGMTAESSFTGSNDGSFNADSVTGCMYGDTFRVSTGEHIGMEAIAHGTPMQYTVNTHTHFTIT